MSTAGRLARLAKIEAAARLLQPAGGSCPTCGDDADDVPQVLYLDVKAPRPRVVVCPTCRTRHEPTVHPVRGRPDGAVYLCGVAEGGNGLMEALARFGLIPPDGLLVDGVAGLRAFMASLRAGIRQVNEERRVGAGQAGGA